MKKTTLETRLNADQLERIISRLWSKDSLTPSQHVFAILDGARDEQIYQIIGNSKRPYSCLYLEPLTDKLRACAPYLVQLDEPCARMLIQKSWGENWGVYLSSRSRVPIHKIRHQYRKITFVSGPKGKRLLFRYYDPRVLRVYLPTCHATELDYFFGAITDIFMEGDATHSLLHFHHSSAGSSVENVELA